MPDRYFEIEDGTLVVTGPWTEAAGEELARPETRTLTLNYALGFEGFDVEFIDSDWDLDRLNVLDRGILDASPIERQTSLRDLSVQAAPGVELDLAALPDLESFGGEWSLIAGSFAGATSLRKLITWIFTEPDLRAFRDHVALEHLEIKEARRLGALDGIEALPSLARLSVALSRQLEHLEPISELAGSLRQFDFSHCPMVSSIAPVASLEGLEVFGCSESRDIDSLSPLAELSSLAVIYAYGTTRIVDGDLSPLLGLPLDDLRIQSRRSYTPSVAEVKHELGIDT